MMIFGIVLQVLVLRPMIGEPVISVIMVTIGLSIFFQAIMKWLFGVFTQPFPPIFAVRSVDILGLNVQPAYLMSLVISILIMGGFAWFFKYSRLGLAMRATAFNQQVAQSLGISDPPCPIHPSGNRSGAKRIRAKEPPKPQPVRAALRAG